MQSAQYTNVPGFQCLEYLKGTSTELTLSHFGREDCRPYHVFAGTHEEYIIHFVLSGRGFYSANGNTWSLGGGQMFLIYPNDPVVYCADRSVPWSYCWIGFRGSRADAILKQCGFSRQRLISSAPDPGLVGGCFDEMFGHVTLDYADEIYRESVLLKVLAILCQHYAQLSRSGNVEQMVYAENTYINQALEYINESYMQGITVLDIANHIGVFRAHLNHVFQEELNLSVQKFLIDFRMHKAASMLVNTSLSVKEISHDTGYSDQLVFSRAFKKKFGISPKNYRTCDDKLIIRQKRPE